MPTRATRFSRCKINRNSWAGGLQLLDGIGVEDARLSHRAKRAGRPERLDERRRRRRADRYIGHRRPHQAGAALGGAEGVGAVVHVSKLVVDREPLVEGVVERETADVGGGVQRQRTRVDGDGAARVGMAGRSELGIVDHGRRRGQFAAPRVHAGCGERQPIAERRGVQTVRARGRQEGEEWGRPELRGVVGVARAVQVVVRLRFAQHSVVVVGEVGRELVAGRPLEGRRIGFVSPAAQHSIGGVFASGPAVGEGMAVVRMAIEIGCGGRDARGEPARPPAGHPPRRADRIDRRCRSPARGWRRVRMAVPW